MPISAFQISVPPFIQGLTGLSSVLDKAVAQLTERGVDPSVLLQYRLYPDMLSFTRQIQIGCDFAKGGAGRLAQDDFPTFEDAEASFEDLKGRVERTIAYLRGLTPAQFEGAEDREVSLVRRGETMTFNALDYLLSQAKPNFYFHITTAYAILRHNGVAIGKKDFLATA